MRFTKPLIYGIWRHSANRFATDGKFNFTKKIGNKKIELLGKDDLTLEAQVVRYADDIAWVLSDLEEGLNNKILDVSYLQEIIGDFEDSTIAGRLSDIFRGKPKIVELFTVFIFDIINHNLERIQNESNPQEIELKFSNEVGDVFLNLKDVIKEKLHGKYYMARGSQINKERIKALCNFYYEHPKEFVKEIKTMMLHPNFPMRPSIHEKCINYTDYELYEDFINDDKRKNIYRISCIVDFVSALTDKEISRLSETMPVY